LYLVDNEAVKKDIEKRVGAKVRFIADKNWRKPVNNITIETATNSGDHSWHRHQ
jgi:hypothetical protein